MIVEKLRELYPITEGWGPRGGGNPLHTLVATMLSAQCRDDYVDRVMPDLRMQYQSAWDYAKSTPDDIGTYINSINHWKKKAERIHEVSKILLNDHNGQVPMDFKKLTTLPGVGPKTALAVLRRYGHNVGIVVDTHVLRTAYRLGLTSNKTAEKVRADLEVILPKEEWGPTGVRLILHGRATCKARSPKCDECQLTEMCPKLGIKQ